MESNTSATPRKFNGEHALCLPQEEGLDIRLNGVLEGTSSRVKDCFWAGYTKDGKHYLSLNNYPGSFWEVTREDMLLHIED